MTTAEAIKQARERVGETKELTIWRVRGLIARGEIPKPRLNSALVFDWSEKDVDALCKAIRGRGATSCS